MRKEFNKRNKITFEGQTFLSKNDLEVGRVYLYKDGRVVVYLGKDSYDKYVFYVLASALYCEERKWNTYTLAHFELQVEYLCDLAEELMKKDCDPKSIISLKGMPQLHCEFPYVAYDAEIANWWLDCKAKHGKSIPSITSLEGQEKSESLYVGAKELVPGEFYYTGDSWRSIYLYLGRDSEKNFCWSFVGNADLFISDGLMAVRKSGIEYTKSNKKCKSLMNADKDPDASVSRSDRKLIDLNYTVDVSTLNLG